MQAEGRAKARRSQNQCGSQMPRAIVFLIIILVIIAGALVFLSSRAREVPTQQVEIDVTNAAAH